MSENFKSILINPDNLNAFLKILFCQAKIGNCRSKVYIRVGPLRQLVDLAFLKHR